MIEARLAGLVHESAQKDPAERSLHERFIITRIFAGFLALVCLPPYLLWRGIPSVPEYLAIICLVAPILAALILSRTGRLALAHGVSSASLVGFIVCLSSASGGVSSAATIWLACVPIEALLSGSRRAAVTACSISILGVILIAALDAFGVTVNLEPWTVGVAMPIFAIAAIGHAAALAVEHSRAEGARRALMSQRDARDRSLLQAIDDLVTWHDRNGHVLDASAAALKLLGASPASLKGRGLLARVHVSDRPAFLKAISDAAVSEHPIAVQFRLHVDVQAALDRFGANRPEGNGVIWAETRAHRIEDESAAEAGGYAVVAVTRDVSEHRRHADELEGARADAERADESKSRFLATVSHELRTPLNAIIGFSEMLAAEGALAMGPERRKEYAQIVHDSGQHLLGVVNTLLDISKIETGNFKLVPEPFDPAALVGSCCDLMQLKADQTGIALARDIAGDLPEVVADGRACRQILINLLSNAVKFTSRGGRVTVSARRSHDRIVFSVADTGVGIAEHDLPRLGDPFFQACSAYARTHEGTGLGLSVVRGLLGLHGGELIIESALGEGTLVSASLPLDSRTGKAPPTEPIRIQTIARQSTKVTAMRSR